MKEKIALCVRKLRKKQTPEEIILWEKLRNRRFLAIKFLRQHPILFEMEGKERFFIADFFCFEKNLVIEVDGGIHSLQKEHDQYRDLIIKELGFHVIRVSNKTIKENLDSFLIKILAPQLS